MGKSRPKAIISDIDGCLAHFMPLLQSMPPGDWDHFHEKCYDLEVCDNDVRDTLIQGLGQGFTIVIVSNRPDKYSSQTGHWLWTNGIPFSQLWLHPDGWKSNITWKSWIAIKTKHTHDVQLAIDDDPVQCEHYRNYEIPVKYVHSSAYDDSQPWRSWGKDGVV